MYAITQNGIAQQTRNGQEEEEDGVGVWGRRRRRYVNAVYLCHMIVVMRSHNDRPQGLASVRPFL